MVRTADRVVRSPRIAARRREVRAQKRRRRRRIIITLIVVAGIASGAWIMMRSSVFSLQKIDVVGAVSLSKQEIVDASARAYVTDPPGEVVEAALEVARSA